MTPVHLLQDIARALEAWAPPATAQSYDNVGLQVGDPTRPVRRGLIALDLTPAVVAEARSLEADVIVTHHPLLFRPLRHLTPAGLVNHLALELARHDIALYAIHTNLDAAPGGVSFALAATLGLEDMTVLQPLPETRYLLVTRVPAGHAGPVRDALAAAGATPRPPLGEAPVVEVALDRWALPAALAALQAVLPGHEADVIPLAGADEGRGMGVIGTLPAPMPLPDFLEHVSTRLDAGSLRYVGPDDQVIRRVAVCGGAGSDLAREALARGADAFVTADVTYHRFFEVLANDGAPRMALIDAGHYETEACTEHLLLDWLTDRFPAVTWHRTRHRTSPVRSYVPEPHSSHEIR